MESGKWTERHALPTTTEESVGQRPGAEVGSWSRKRSSSHNSCTLLFSSHTLLFSSHSSTFCPHLQTKHLISSFNHHTLAHDNSINSQDEKSFLHKHHTDFSTFRPFFFFFFSDLDKILFLSNLNANGSEDMCVWVLEAKLFLLSGGSTR